MENCKLKANRRFLFLFSGKSVEHAQKAYFRLKERVFHGSRPFLSEPLENFLIDEFGKETMMSSFSHPRYIFLIDKFLMSNVMFLFFKYYHTLVNTAFY